MKLGKIFLEKLQIYYPQIIIISLILLVYIQNLWFDYSYLDDTLLIFTEYEKINSILKIPETFLTGYLLDNYYRPMILISFIIDTAIAGQSSTMYHLTNILLHIVFSLMLFKLLLKFHFTNKVAFVATLLFALHPINTNAVSWLAGRNDLIVGVFSLASFLSFLRYDEEGNKVWLIVHLFTFFIALYAKEIGIMVIALIIIYIYLFERNSIKRKSDAVILFSLWSIIIISYLYIRFFVVQINTQEKAGFNYLINNLYIIIEYIAKLFYLPAITPLSIKSNELLAIGSIILMFLVIIWFRLRLYKSKLAIFGILIFLLFILPTLILSQKTVSGEFIYIDCRLYFPLVGLVIFLSVLLEKVKIENPPVNIVLLLFIIYSMVFTLIKSSYYKNGENFWTEVTSTYPEVSSHWVGYGFYYYDNNEYLKAAELVEKAISLRIDIPEYYHKAAMAYEKADLLEKANILLERVLPLEEDKTITLVKLIKNNLRLGHIEKSLEYKDEFKKIEISDIKKKADLYSSLAYYFSYSGLMEQSIELMKEAINLHPTNPIYFNDLGVFYYNTGKLDSAKYFFSEAHRLDPDNQSYLLKLAKLNKVE